VASLAAVLLTRLAWVRGKCEGDGPEGPDNAGLEGGERRRHGL